MDAIEEICLAEDIVIDKENKLVTTPAFMLNASLTQIHRGISKLVHKILKMHNNTIVEWRQNISRERSTNHTSQVKEMKWI